MGINARGTFATTQACLKYMREAGFGHVITQSPPVTLDKLKGMTAYVAVAQPHCARPSGAHANRRLRPRHCTRLRNRM